VRLSSTTGSSTTGSRARMPARTGPPETAGRWAILPEVDPDPTRRAHATAERLLDRHGVVTRGAVVSERVPGGFAAVYKVLSTFEESGRCRRGYFVAGLGAAQFGTAGAIDRLRTFAEPPGTEATGVGPGRDTGRDSGRAAVALAATDPANPFGAALPWPTAGPGAPGDATTERSGHRPGRKAGALVVLVEGELALYVERGGRTLLTWSEDPEVLVPATSALADAVRRGSLGRLTVEKADGEQLLGAGSTPLREALQAAGFVSTPRGLRLRTASGA
jgi:ATP-dependent Lhr-like helicase